MSDVRKPNFANAPSWIPTSKNHLKIDIIFEKPYKIVLLPFLIQVGCNA
jgi:hypothetical protein